MRAALLIAAGAVTIAAAGGALIHPYGPATAPQEDRGILREAQIDASTLSLIERACRNCHSEQTEWPWYSRLAPVSWLLARDVHEAREHMNLSRWQEYDDGERLRLLSAMGSAARNRVMPPGRSTLLHPEARLTDAERGQIYGWTRSERRRVAMRSVAIAPGAQVP